jgi:hypothetical protein
LLLTEYVVIPFLFPLSCFYPFSNTYRHVLQKGGVFQILLDSRYVINYSRTVLNDLELASSIATRLSSLPECKGLPTYPLVPLASATAATPTSSVSSSISIESVDVETLRKVYHNIKALFQLAVVLYHGSES